MTIEDFVHRFQAERIHTPMTVCRILILMIRNILLVTLAERQF